MSDEVQSQTFDTGREISRIRDIIFGAEMRNYDKQFQAIQRELEQLRQQLQQLGAQLAQQDATQTQRLSELEQTTLAADNALRNELQAAVKMLTQAKVDRVALGEMLAQIGASLKSSSPSV